jgi:hypothetical protein
MSAVAESCSPNADANRIRREIERLSQEQSKALETAMYAVMSPTEQNQYDQRHRQIVDLLKQLTAVDAGDFSKLSARMVELSLQEAKCDPTLQDTVPKERGFVSSPLLWPSSDVQRIASPSFENTGRTESVARKASAAARHLNRQQAEGTSGARMDQWFFTFRKRILAPLTLAAERSVIRQRTELLIGNLSKLTVRAAQFVADGISTTYRCRDCGRELGFRSRPRTSVECYILPLLLMQPIRCAACFRRDYWLILTTVRKRSHGDDETVEHIPRRAASRIGP